MLFSIRPGLEHSRVFDALNFYLREVVLAALESRAVNQGNMPLGLYAAVISNLPTRDAAATLQISLNALDQGEKDALRNELLPNTEPCDFLVDTGLPLVAIPDSVFDSLKVFAVHLYQRTCKLTDVELACGEGIDDHYARFRSMLAPGNGNVCCVCGTEALSQMQSGVDDNEQWRGPYDHLLAKDRYPLYGVHPRNLLPICQTCNSKAKLAKDLLILNGNRRLSFSPWIDHVFENEILVTIDDTNVLFPRVVVELSSGDPARSEKLRTWDDIYKIRARVEGEFLDLIEKITEDISASDHGIFLDSLNARVAAKLVASRRTPFSYWRSRVYRAVRNMPPISREVFRVTIDESMADQAALEDLFFN